MSRIEPGPGCREEPCPCVEGAERIAQRYAPYLSDESRTSTPSIETLYLPRTKEEVSSALAECFASGRGITVSGARTGIVGGAVALESSAVLALERLNRIHSIRYEPSTNGFYVRLEPGVTLAALQNLLQLTPPHRLPWADKESETSGTSKLESSRRGLFYPVDPTEMTAHIGGTVSTNASGARTFHYGPTRGWVTAATIALSCGQLLTLRRGEICAANDVEGGFTLLLNGEERPVPIPKLSLPQTKHNAGYHLSSGMDAIDLFIGSEGTLGVVVELELRLIMEPWERLALTAFLPSEAAATQLVAGIRGAYGASRFRAANLDSPANGASTVRSDAAGAMSPAAPRSTEGATLLAMEYVGPRALALLRERRREQGSSAGVPAIPEEAVTTLYLEFAYEHEEELLECYEKVRGELERAGTSAAKTWAGTDRGQRDAMKAFRHALPEHINATIGLRRASSGQELHKIGTDMAVPDQHLERVIRLYRSKLDELGLEYVLFGHIGDNHLHVNILPDTRADVEKAMDLYDHFAKEVVAMGGSVSAEHGIGRLKRHLLPLQFAEHEIEQMRAIKRAFDPKWILNPGVLFPAPQ